MTEHTCIEDDYGRYGDCVECDKEAANRAEQRVANQIADWLVRATGVTPGLGEGRIFWDDVEAIRNGEWRK